METKNRAVKWFIQNCGYLAGILFLYVVVVWGLLECMEREDRIAQLEARHAQQMMESCR
jgi:hypothetical protein